ncbi:hypothetical protein QM277_01630, partial [Acinetobacter baumannii]|nr:hypothetical protein [Acinetobacter baumannii]
MLTLRQTRYGSRPKLGVCQVNVNGNVYLLDGVSLDLSEFWKKIFLAQQN